MDILYRFNEIILKSGYKLIFFEGKLQSISKLRI